MRRLGGYDWRVRELPREPGCTGRWHELTRWGGGAGAFRGPKLLHIGEAEDSESGHPAPEVHGLLCLDPESAGEVPPMLALAVLRDAVAAELLTPAVTFDSPKCPKYVDDVRYVPTYLPGLEPRASMYAGGAR